MISTFPFAINTSKLLACPQTKVPQAVDWVTQDFFNSILCEELGECEILFGASSRLNVCENDSDDNSLFDSDVDEEDSSSEVVSELIGLSVTSCTTLRQDNMICVSHCKEKKEQGKKLNERKLGRSFTSMINTQRKSGRPSLARGKKLLQQFFVI